MSTKEAEAYQAGLAGKRVDFAHMTVAERSAYSRGVDERIARQAAEINRVARQRRDRELEL